MHNKTVAIVGATGAVGREFIGCIERRGIPLKGLKLLASARSAGQTATFRGEALTVEETTDAAFDGVDIALFSAGSGISKQFASIAIKAGAVVVDNSSAFRADPEIPLVIPEINAQEIRNHRGIIANPNCAAITTLVPLWPIHSVNPVKRLIVSTYQAASGGGAALMEELEESTRAYLDGREYAPNVVKYPYAFNLFSHNTAIDPETGYNDEETKVIKETRKILNDAAINVSATCVRVPVLRAHSVSMTFECERPISPEEVRELLGRAPGVRLIDDWENNYFPMPKDASGQDDVLAGRIRRDLSDPSGRSISMFVAADQLLKGAALNAVQIAELL
ncbi:MULTISPECIES: aspartate-semialdehyde dehydrogenase [Asticcacaulis]|uniref:aspartate-semialdehyde dehydrogenase n=1 Tax=Asticcacaulis TaxID=76890 RepID=UPI001AE7E105|nr:MULTISPECIES: aspartate-semialdehyde dehydrogenase [Asticcacaulis]MBP2158727.1 aspartate-semialdehyde dehydrogenase [Asticcacaulis solisilvae]MDR6799773.1 aspartate-semialdehyde dehydrogenase [Asticcacaulis sp. BE141]